VVLQCTERWGADASATSTLQGQARAGTYTGRVADTRRGTTAKRTPASPGAKPEPASKLGARSGAARPIRRQGDATRNRILRTAQKLFAHHGIDAVSLNQIVGAAKVNTAAIHYHFRSKDGLIEAILDRGASQLGQRREEMLDAIEVRGDYTLRDLVEVMVVPIAQLKVTPLGLDYARFLASVSLHPRYSAYLAELTDAYVTRLLALLEKVTPDLSHAVRLRRFAYAGTFIYDAITVDDQTVDLWMQVHGEQTDERAATADLIDLLSGGLGATPSARASRRRR
jgi:AcrR family transcriptional regulator